MPPQSYPLEPMGEESSEGTIDIENQPRFEGSGTFSGGWKKRMTRKKHIILAVCILASWIGIYLAVTAFHSEKTISEPSSRHSPAPRRSFTIDNVLDGEFDYHDITFEFIKPADVFNSKDVDSGLYLGVDKSSSVHRFVAKKLADVNYYEELGETSFEYNGIDYTVSSFKPSYNLKRAIVATNLERERRHSSHAYYWLRDIKANTMRPITPYPDSDSLFQLSFVRFSPCYNFIYFVHENNLYIQYINEIYPPQQITFDGSSTIFNAKPDWVYEEDVLASDEAIWWAPDDSKFVFAKFNDTNVGKYEYPKYTDAGQYTKLESILYPKPGTPNPQIKIYMFDIHVGTLYEVGPSQKPTDDILYAAQWISPDIFMFKQADRSSKVMTVKTFDLKKSMLNTIKVVNATSYNGWIDKVRNVQIIPPKPSLGREEFGYVDILVDADGFPHLFYFPSALSGSCRQITNGAWEVTGKGVVGYDLDSDTVFFLANMVGTLSQHLYSVSLVNHNSGVETRQDPNKDDFYDFEMSFSCRFATKKYLGPNKPMTEAGPLTALLENNKSNEILQLTQNEELRAALEKYEFPITSYQKISLEDGLEINFIEIKPRKMDTKRKYPLLVQVYGGPGSQTVDTKFNVMFEESIVSSLDAIVLRIEPRGTAGRGWSFRSWVKGQIGYWEPRDVTEVTQKFIETNIDNIDPDRVAIWGWSYGGFVTLKSLEYDQGRTFKYGIAVAPVTDWRYYNSIYTERYMGLLDENEKGYNEISLIKDIDGFSKLQRLLIMHGTADDNVHLQNSLQLIDRLNLNNIRNYDMQLFPDSDHSISFHNAGRVIYGKLSEWIKDAFNGKYDFVDN